MKITLMKTTLGMLALGLMTGAQAGGDRGGHASRQAFQQSQAYSQQINARQDRQATRIQAAMRAGRLTRHEFRSLMHEQHKIRAMERSFRADGVIDAREFQRLDRALDLASRTIRAEAHDRQARAAYGHPSRFNQAGTARGLPL
jgi:uncharacterized membrane protein YebE (DUF533 family)